MPNSNSTAVVQSKPFSWRDVEFHSVKRAAEIVGLSTASIYALEAQGKLEFRRIAGRVLIPTSSLAGVVDGAEPWQALPRGNRARAAGGQQ